MSTPDTFRDTLADVLMQQWPNTITRRDAARVTADAVLASDEMQAIRKALRSMASTLKTYHLASFEYTVRNCYHLPDHVADWVLDDPSPNSPADKSCWECNDTGTLSDNDSSQFQPCPSCRGGEPT